MYPVLSWLAFVLSTGALVGVFAGRSFLPRLAATPGQAYWLGVADVAVALLGGAVLTSLFNVGLVHNAIRTMRKENPRVRDGLYAGIRTLDRVVFWGVVSSTVGPVGHLVERVDPSGGLVERLLGGPWSTAAFFVLPVLAFEEATISRLFDRGRQLYRKTWGYTGGASLGVDLVAVLLAIPLVIVGGYAQTASLAPVTVDVLSAVAVVGLLVVLLLRQVAVGVAKAALYIYATTNRTPTAFTGVDFSRVSWQRGPPEE